ncbi:MAG: hypothetical protein RIB59_02615 [Rhodospirillales bacterium]
MPRKPNYRHDRFEREKAKAAKKAESLKQKQEKRDRKRLEDDIGSVDNEMKSRHE